MSRKVLLAVTGRLVAAGWVVFVGSTAAASDPTVNLSRSAQTSVPHLTVTGAVNSLQYEIQRSSDLRSWVSVAAFVGNAAPVEYDDLIAGTPNRAFYRVGLAMLASPPIRTFVPTQDVWVSRRADGLPGSGTQSNPFNGSTQVGFDAVMAAIPPNCAIHLGPGTFRTAVARPWLVKPGWVVTGAGMDVTTVQLAGNAANITSVSCFSSDPNTSTDNVTISDLTIDCNWPELSQTAVIGDTGESTTAIAAAYIFGSYNVIERVHFINAYGSWGNLKESFGLAFASPVNSTATGDVIRFCRADSPHGNYGAPFALHGRATHSITNSMIISNTAVGINDGLANGFTSGGANLAYDDGCIVEGNTFIDCFGIAYQDTGTLKNLTVHNNVATRAWYGVGITLMNSAWAADRVTITNNNMNIQNRLVGRASYGIIFGGEETVVTNVLINSNAFARDTAGKGLNDIQPIADLTKLTDANARIQNNVTNTDPYTSRSYIRSTGVCLFNNRDFDGTSSLGLEDNSLTPCP